MRTTYDRERSSDVADEPRATGFGRTTRDLPARSSRELPAPAPPEVLHALDVQLQRNQDLRDGGDDPFALHLIARDGVAGGGGPVPYAAEIQPLMPGLDLSTVRAHQGAEAQGAARAIGAEAYATGNDVALPAQPSRELVGHELAHVAQQRGGVSLSGGVGRAGDPYEREADAIGARVAAGRSAADLMPAAVRDAGGAGAVQRQAADDHEAAHAGIDDGPDVAWIDELPERMTKQIDREFSAGSEKKANETARERDPTAVVATNKKGVTWEAGRLNKRTRFMKWGVSLLGSAAAVKTHFRGLTRVGKGRGEGAYLSREAATRYQQALAWFEDRYPGNTFPDTTVGQALRGRHQTAHGRGMQGHPLGLSLDFDAYTNVDQRDGVASFMLKKFGGGPNKLEIGKGSAAAVQAIGKTSADGGELSNAQQKYLTDAEEAYDAMFATSERFKSALGPGEAKLKAVQSRYYATVQPGSKAVAALEKQLAHARKAAKKRIAKGGGDGDADADPEVAALIASRDERMAAFETAKAEVTAALEEAFAPWIASLEADIDGFEEGHSRGDLDAAVDAGTAAKARKRAANAKDARSLRRLIEQQPAVFAGVDPDFADADFEAVKAAAAAQAARVEQARKRHADEIAPRLELIRRFRDPRAVFGEGQLVSGKWKQTLVASEPPIIQYLERGFARNDELGTDVNDPKEVFNGEFVTAMMRFGFHPGAAWKAVDTMHFDFQEGFDAVTGTGQFGG